MDDEETEENVNEEVLIVFDRQDNKIKQLHGSLLTPLHEISCNLARDDKNTDSAIVVGQEIYVFDWQRKVYSINPFDEKSYWQSKARPEHGHGADPAAAVLEGTSTNSNKVTHEIYLCGGGWERAEWHRNENWQLHKLTDNCEKYNLDSETWDDIASMKQKKRVHSVIEMNGYIYSMGGVGEQQVSDDESEPEEKKCINDQEVQVKQEDMEVNSEVKRIEGPEEPLSLVEKYDKGVGEAGAWSSVAPMNEPRVSPAVAKYDGKIYVLGGGVNNEYLASVEFYDSTTAIKMWTYLSPMTAGRIKFRAFVLDGKLFSVGSGGRQYGRKEDYSIEFAELDNLNNNENEEWKKEENWLAGTDCNFMATVKMALPRSIQTE